MIGYRDGRVIHGHKYRPEFVHHASEQRTMKTTTATTTVIAALADADSSEIIVNTISDVEEPTMKTTITTTIVNV
eukprot:4792150-Karenia_brevis.AAC.1